MVLGPLCLRFICTVMLFDNYLYSNATTTIQNLTNNNFGD